MKKIIWIFGLLSFAGIAALVRFGNSPDFTRTPASLTFAVPTSVPAELEFRPESQRRYTYSFRRQIELSGFANNAPKVGYEGKFTLDVTKTSEEGFTAVAQAAIAGYAGQAPLVQVKFDRSGRKVTLQTEATSSEEAQQYIAITKDLLTLWDFAADTDTLGKYEASVETVPSSKGTVVQKKAKLHYLTQTDTQITHSLHWLKWDNALHLPAEVKGEEQTRLGRNGTTLDTKTAYHLRFEGKRGFPAYSVAQLAKLKHSESLVLTAGKATDNLEYGKVDWNALAEKLRAIQNMKPGEQLAAFGELVRLLKRDPAALANVLALLSAKDIHAGADSALFKTIVGALATAGTPESQRELIGLYQNPASEISGKGVILTAFTTTQAAPTSETTEFLVKETSSPNRDIREGAAFALGSGLQIATNDSAVNTLLRLWQSAVQSGNINAEISALDAIGNSGRAEFYPILNTIIQGNQAALQPKATFSLRFMNTTDSRGLLTTQMNSVKDEIRSAAVGAVALAPWTEQFRTPVQLCSGHEAVADIQKACDEILHAHPQVAGN